jgi:alpha-tubulin suppressor-like RCC1 family protein
MKTPMKNRLTVSTPLASLALLATAGMASVFGCASKANEPAPSSTPATPADSGTSVTADGGDASTATDGSSSTKVQAVAGKSHTCAILSGGKVKCWGKDSVGQLGLALGIGGDDKVNPRSLAFVDLGGFATALALGGEHSCALLDDGSVKCWGNNNSGQLGIGGAYGSAGLSPGSMGANLLKVELGAKAVAITAGESFACALLEDATVKCWGNNNLGQLGYGNNDDYFAPAIPINTGAKVKSISAGDKHTCAVLEGGSVKCWGDNVTGQLGLGDTNSRCNANGQSVASLAAVDLGGPVASVSAGAYHTCAILEGGKVKCWGSNGDGQLGLGDMTSRGDKPNQMGANLPAIDLDGVATAVVTGNNHTCAILEGGKVKCWGWNQYGVVGLGEPGSRGDSPNEMGANLPPLSLPSTQHLSTRDTHVCATSATGEVRCWGENSNGNLGYDDKNSRSLVGPATPPVVFE